MTKSQGNVQSPLSRDQIVVGPVGLGSAPALSPTAARQKNSPAVAQKLEALYLQHARTLEASVRRVLEGIARCRPRRRPGRSHERRSRRPANKWRDRKKKSTS